VYERLCKRVINLGPQPSHRRLNYIGAGIKVDVPNLFDDPGARDDLSSRSRQTAQQYEFATGKMEIAPGPSGLVPASVNLQIGDPQNLLLYG
jgi:hypothetical protein